MITVLLIEDNITHSRLIWKILGSSEYSLISAIDGRQGLEIASFCEPDVILLDMHLPDMTGETVLRMIHTNPKLKNVPVVAVTADAMHGDRERILRMGFDGYVAKPISRLELSNALDHALAEHDAKAN